MTAIEIKGIRIDLPSDITSSHHVGPSGHAYLVHVDSDGARWIDMSTQDCESILLNSSPSCAPWRAANPVQFQRLGGQVQKLDVGICIAAYRGALEATRPRHPLDRGGILNDTLREMGVRR
jgi:hypothetical protein